ncbi:MAG: adenosine kinase [Desulfamplus sp.]|nr:adenosine kinase [Desulfamplus sp.]
MVRCRFQSSIHFSGKVLSIITPDAQRSMFTCLGASTELEPNSITPDLFKDSGIALMEGYLLFNPALMMACLKSAKKAGSMIAMDLASFEVVNASKEILNEIVTEYVDILIANEDEAFAYTGFSDEIMAIKALSQNVRIAVLKVGVRGSYVSFNGEIIQINPITGAKAKDTTGAGDLWAAGFLFGIANGFSIEKSGEIGSACGYEVCQVMGAQIPEDGWQRILRLLAS